MDWNIVAMVMLVVLAVVVTAFMIIKSQSVRVAFAEFFVKVLKENEAWIVMAIYNSLPNKMSQRIDSKDLATIIGKVIEEISVIILDRARK